MTELKLYFVADYFVGGNPVTGTMGHDRIIGYSVGHDEAEAKERWKSNRRNGYYPNLKFEEVVIEGHKITLEEVASAK